MTLLAFPAPALPPSPADETPLEVHEVPLRGGRCALIDAADWESIRPYRWRVGSDGYAYAQTSASYYVAMHRLLVFGGQRMPRHVYVHHRNDVRTDNRRRNLFVASNELNQAARAVVQGKVPFKGVCHLPNGRFQSQIKVRGISEYLGSFRDPMDAAVRYAERALEVWGTWAWIQPEVRAELERRRAQESNSAAAEQREAA